MGSDTIAAAAALRKVIDSNCPQGIFFFNGVRTLLRINAFPSSPYQVPLALHASQLCKEWIQSLPVARTGLKGNLRVGTAMELISLPAVTHDPLLRFSFASNPETSLRLFRFHDLVVCGSRVLSLPTGP